MSKSNLPELTRLGHTMLWDTLYTRFIHQWQSIKMLLILRFFLTFFLQYVPLTFFRFWLWQYPLYYYYTNEQENYSTSYHMVYETYMTPLFPLNSSFTRFYQYFILYIFEFRGKLFLISLYKKQSLEHYRSLSAYHWDSKQLKRKVLRSFKGKVHLLSYKYFLF